jgi:hypothetical protein
MGLAERWDESFPTPRESRWAAAGAALGTISFVLMATGAIADRGDLALGGFGLLLVAHFCASMADAFGKEAEAPRPLRVRILAGFLALAFLLVLGALVSGVAALFVGFATAFRWVPVLLPLAALWFAVSGGIGALARRLAGRYSPKSLP